MHSSIRPAAVFTIWTLTSFFCHRLAKLAMGMTSSAGITSPGERMQGPVFVTLVQCLCCFASVKMTSPSRSGPLLYVMVTSHVLATLATNVSLSMTWATCTLAVKMLEPVSSALLQRLLLSSPLPPHTALGTIVIVVGAAMYVLPTPDIISFATSDVTVSAEHDVKIGENDIDASDVINTNDVMRAAALAMLSNVILGVRNVALKLSANEHGSKQPTLQLRGTPGLVGASFLIFGVVFPFATYYVYTTNTADNFPALSSNAFSSPEVSLFLAVALSSGAFHVTYSYVSTNVVLRYMSVLSHALLNICKRVLIVLLLHVSGRRRASLWNWSGLALCFLGLLWYQSRRVSSHKSSASQDHAAESAHKAHSERSVCEKERYRKASRLGQILLALCFPFLVVCLITPGPQHTLNVSGNNYSYGLKNGGPQGLVDEGSLVAGPQPPNVQPRGSSTTLTGTQQLFSRVKVYHTRNRLEKNKTKDYFMRLFHGYSVYVDNRPLLKGPVQFQPEKKTMDVDEFLSRPVLDAPFDTDALSPYLGTAQEVIDETRRIHHDLFRDLLAGRKYAILFLLASHENKGDSAITLGEVVLLHELGVELVHYVDFRPCSDAHIMQAYQIALRYPKEQFAVLLHGGGNIIGYNENEICRQKVFRVFRGYYTLFFPQSILTRGSPKQLQDAVSLYCCNHNLTILLRDRQSLAIGRRLFSNGTRLVLAPDIAFCLDRIPRQFLPYYDVLWLTRIDAETGSDSTKPQFPKNVSVHRVEWKRVPSLPSKTSLGIASNVLNNGLDILQQGRVVVTERLHGHILCLLLDIPHVLVDNDDRKLTAYLNTWTRGVDILRVTTRADHAARLAMELLDKYGHRLPKRIRAFDIDDSLH